MVAGWHADMNPDRYFSPDPTTRNIARELYQTVSTLPIVSPHGHVDPRLFSDPNATFGSPADLFVIPDHYVTRMLYSQGIPLESLLTGDHRTIWKLFCENFYLFRGTPSGIWLTQELNEVFGVDEKPNASKSKSCAPLTPRRIILNIIKPFAALVGVSASFQPSAPMVWSILMR
jgi:glucuronate isomerase